MERINVNVLGSIYKIEILNPRRDKLLETCDGYMDKTTRRIVVDEGDNKCTLDRIEEHVQKVMRHELVHAFLYESGLMENCDWAMNEEIVDWIAIQIPKIAKAMEEAGCLNTLKAVKI